MKRVYNVCKSIFVCLDPIVLTMSIISGANSLSWELSGDVELVKGIYMKHATILLGEF